MDEAFYQQAAQRLWENVQPVTAWTNAMLQPPPPHAIDLLVAASQRQVIANAFADLFNAPDKAWEIFSAPAHMAAFLQRFGWTPVSASNRHE